MSKKTAVAVNQSPGPKEVVGLENCVLVQVFRDGQEVARREGRNTVVQDGMALLANRAFADEAAGPNRIRFMQLGKGGTAPTSAQTNIGTEISSATLSGRQTAQTMAMSGTRTAKWEHTWTAGEFAANGVREVGLFDQSTTAGGEMFARFTFTTVNKTAADTIKVTWTLKIQ